MKFMLLGLMPVVSVIIIVSDIKVTRINYCDAIKKIRNIVYGRKDD